MYPVIRYTIEHLIFSYVYFLLCFLHLKIMCQETLYPGAYQLQSLAESVLYAPGSLIWICFIPKMSKVQDFSYLFSNFLKQLDTAKRKDFLY